MGRRARKNQPSAGSASVPLISTLGHHFHDITASRWSSRGWTYQEAVLSRRCLVFTDYQTYFECAGMNCHELVLFDLDLMHTPDRSSLHSFLCSGMFAGDSGSTELQSSRSKRLATGTRFLLRYLTHIKNYSRRSLSFTTDRLKAFAGIMRNLTIPRDGRMAGGVSQLGGLPYVHGHGWEDDNHWRESSQSRHPTV